MINTFIDWGVTARRRQALSAIIHEAFGVKLSFLLRRRTPEECVVTVGRLLRFEDGLVYEEDGKPLGVATLKRQSRSPYFSREVIQKEIGWLRARVLTTFVDEPIHDADAVRIDMLAVRGDHRGEGIGTKLIERVFQDAARDGMMKVTLDVIDTNVGAKRLYESLGFVVTKTRPVPCAGRYGFHAVIDMERRLR
jgi:ribosomal protein S18 acetylase RimI-like enzyme